ncbi:C1 family peptidase [Mesorhizobium shangrilense]|uniref:C1 family peptidase n=1 Tax=Mesorhizobium shangrilense TaxID=460060 RepID=A0ABV2DLL4_9HYPH
MHLTAEDRSRVLNAIAVVVVNVIFAGGASAQSPTAEEPPETPDPLGTHYATGLKLMSTAETRGLPELPTFRAFLPETADLSSRFPLPGDQGGLGSCASWAVGYAARSYYTSTIEGKKLIPATIVSPSYLFNRARSGSCENGSSLSANVYALKDGAVSLAQHPYADKCETILPEEIGRATNFKVQGLSRLDATKIDDVKGRLAQGEPVILSLQVLPSFENYRGGVYELSSTSSEAANHGVVAIGYDDRRQALHIINSWGRKWGERGFMWLSYDAYAKMAEEAVVLHVAGFKPSPPVQPIDTSELSQLIAEINTRTCANLTFHQDGKQSSYPDLLAATWTSNAWRT